MAARSQDWANSRFGNGRLAGPARNLPYATLIILAVLLCALAPAARADDHVPFYLRFAENQCPPWTNADLPRREYMTDAVSPGSPPYRRRGDPPIRLDDVGLFIVNGVGYEIPVGHMSGQISDEVYEDAVRGEGYATTGLYGLDFWMPSGRYVERQFGSYLRFCEPGRLPPRPEEYAVSATVLPPGSEQAAEWRAERLLRRDRTETALGAPLADVLAGRVARHADRLEEGIPGAIVYDGLHWHPEVKESAPNADALRHRNLIVQRNGLFGVINCVSPNVVVVHGDRTRASWTPCEVRHVGPIDSSSPLPEMRYAIPRRDVGEWEEVYWTIVNLIGY